MTSLKDKIILITGASRGIGKAIALRAARDGAKISVVGKTKEAHPRLPGTVYSACEEIEAAGGRALPCVADIRFEEQIDEVVRQTVEAFGGIDILVNNASAISLTGTRETPLKRFDLMHQVNTRGTFATSRACLPFLEKAENPHILMLSPPLNLDPLWFGAHLPYTLAKYGMSLCVLGLAEELRSDGIAVNALWPRTAIATAAVKNLLGGEEALKRCRKPEIMADAAYRILTRPSQEHSGEFLIDDEVLAEAGTTDLSAYAVDPAFDLLPDFFL